MKTRWRLFPALAAAMLLLPATQAHSQTRRALLIGINEYEKDPAGAQRKPARSGGRAHIGPLYGSVNDARAMRDVLTGRYGFLPANVRLLTNAEATRDAIFAAIADLAAASKPGDIVIFYYAGHGSLRRNTGRPGSPDDQLDQTIVPVDANFGAVDIRDKELARALWPVAQKQVVLTLIFDACHSGTITRGEPAAVRYRFAAVDTNDAKDPEPAPPIDSVALHISSVNDYQTAPEKEDAAGVQHGVFTAALVKVLASGAPNASADRIYREVRAMVRSDGSSNQEPVMDGPAWRREASLIDGGKSPVSGRVTVPVIRMVNDSLVEIQGGIALGVREGTELRPADTTSKAGRLTVVRESGLDRSIAQLAAGSTKPASGTLYEVERWGVAPSAQLKVWMPPAISTGALSSALAQVRALQRTPGVQYATDPVAPAAPGRSATLRWERTGWMLYDGTVIDGATSSRTALAASTVRSQTLGQSFTAASVAKQLGASAKSPVRLRVNLPPVAAMRDAIRLGAGTENDAVSVAADPAAAQYLLVGNATAGGDSVEYAFVLSNASVEAQEASGLPLRTAWFAGAGAADSLTSRALTLGRIQQWLAIVPPAGGYDAVFPYKVAFRNAAGSRLSADTLARSDGWISLELALDSTRLNGNPPSPWYVYVIDIDSDGNGTSLCQEGSAHVIQDFPAAWPVTIPRPDCRRFRMQSPFGVEHFVLIASRDQLPTDALNWKGVKRSGERGGAGGLARLLKNTGSSTRTPEMDVVTADWSVERTSVRTMEVRP